MESVRNWTSLRQILSEELWKSPFYKFIILSFAFLKKKNRMDKMKEVKEDKKK